MLDPLFALCCTNTHTSAYVSIRQHTSAYVRLYGGTWVADAGPSVRALWQRQREVVEVLQAPPPALLRRQHAAVRHTCAHIRRRQHTSAYAAFLRRQHAAVRHTCARIRIRQHTSAYVGIRQHPSELGTPAHTYLAVEQKKVIDPHRASIVPQ